MKKASLFLILLLISSCRGLPGWLGAGEEPPLPGERYSVMSLESSLEPDESLKFEEVNLNPQSKVFSNRHQGNYYISGNLDEVKSVDAGNAADDFFFITSGVSSDGNFLYVLDGKHVVRAFDLNLKQVWEKQITGPEDKESYPVGGLSVAENIIYVTSGYGDVIALSANDGAEIWRKNVVMAVRNAPLISRGKIFFINNNNDLFALDAKTGNILWRHNGVSETTKIYGTSSPAIKNNIIIAAYSSGEIFAINADRGDELWSELLSLASDRTKASATINDITASPLIIDGIVYVTSLSGNLSAYNISNGFPIWELALASSKTPFSSGHYLFVTDNDGKVFAINRFSGKIKWVSNLANEEEEKAYYSGPIIAGDKVIIASSGGKLFKLNPQNGAITSTLEIPENIYANISVYNGRIYLYSNDAKLIQVN